MDSALLTLHDVEVDRGGARILGPLDWSVESGQRWVVIGPNGAGKTTLAQLAGLAMAPTRGALMFCGVQPWGADADVNADLDDLAPSVGLCSASVAALVDPDEVVLGLVMTGAYASVAPAGDSYEPADEQRALELLEGVRAAGFRSRRFGTLSSGEQQRVLVARALMSDPELLVMDEPAAGLDLAGREALVSALGRLAADVAAPAQILVTHHVEEVPLGFTHCLMLRDGLVVASGPLISTLTEAGLSQTFGVSVRLVTDGQRFAARALPSWGG